MALQKSQVSQELEQVHNSFINFKAEVKGQIKDVYLGILKNKNESANTGDGGCSTSRLEQQRGRLPAGRDCKRVVRAPDDDARV